MRYRVYLVYLPLKTTRTQVELGTLASWRMSFLSPRHTLQWTTSALIGHQRKKKKVTDIPVQYVRE